MPPRKCRSFWDNFANDLGKKSGDLAGEQHPDPPLLGACSVDEGRSLVAMTDTEAACPTGWGRRSPFQNCLPHRLTSPMGRERDFAATLAMLGSLDVPDKPHQRAKIFVPGRLAQLGERLPYKQEVTGSSPVPPTQKIPVNRGFFVGIRARSECLVTNFGHQMRGRDVSASQGPFQSA